MTFEFVHGNIIEAKVDALVNPVNCVGVMGRGLALQFKRAFPTNFLAYKTACDSGNLLPGRVFVFQTGWAVPRYIVNFPTKRHWRDRSRMEDIEAGLTSLANEIMRRPIRSVAIPPLGCGLGGLSWDEVKPRIIAAIDQIDDVHAFLFEPLEKDPNLYERTETLGFNP